MRFTAEREKILAALTFVGKYAARGPKIPILANVRIDASDGAVTVVATDCEQSARQMFPSAIDRPGSVCLPVELLRKTIDASAGSEVFIDADDRQARVVCGKQRFVLPVMPASDFPILPMLDSEKGETFTLPGELLTRVTKEVAFAVIDPRGAYYLTGVSWRSQNGAVYFCATDTHRLSMLSAPCSRIFDVIVPPFEIPAWQENVDAVVTETFIRLSSGTQTIASKLIEATYPEVRNLIPASTQAILIDRVEFLAAVKRAGLVASSVLIIGRDGLASFSASSSGQNADDEVAYEGADFQIVYAVDLLASVLSSFDCEMIRFGFVAHDATGVLTDPRDDTRVALAFPLRDARVVQYLPAMAAE
ncbi:DNA polymerase III subunit beta [Mesorhizobium sp. B2-3-4]|uniref:DNA polymerase III subunit beta n=1 Tax=Mesorhizobium sp. B2-3-4 TaxID=2589959 RepID=UPI00112E934A|nr:DNA polymerase III subunit beta [Mesorhizobium sp. B2-3-4]TPM39605.1 DNA polymerase III subunit beta [Mesorhizobium sp. B2-3-4]